LFYTNDFLTSTLHNFAKATKLLRAPKKMIGNEQNTDIKKVMFIKKYNQSEM
jgi:hypothetical protein